jgi:hypothetical protein
MLMRFRYLLTMLTLTVSLFTVGCRGGKPVVTPEDAAGVGATLSGIVEKATAKMLDAYKAGTVPATVADPFFKAVDEKVLPISRRARTATAAWHAAEAGVPKIKSGEELKAVLADLEREAKAVFGVALPPGVATSIGTIAAELYDAIAKIRSIIAQARASIDPSGNPECILRTCAALGEN